jgi:hypothetical protein
VYLELQAIQRYCWTTHFTVHRCTHIWVFSLHYTYPGNWSITVSLSLQITHEVVFVPPNSFLAISSQSPSTSIARTETNSRQQLNLYCSIEFFFITTLNGPHWKQHLLLSRIVLCVFTAPLHSNGCGANQIEKSPSIVEECLLSRCLAMGIYVRMDYMRSIVFWNSWLCVYARCWRPTLTYEFELEVWKSKSTYFSRFDYLHVGGWSQQKCSSVSIYTRNLPLIFSCVRLWQRLVHYG